MKKIPQKSRAMKISLESKKCFSCNSGQFYQNGWMGKDIFLPIQNFLHLLINQKTNQPTNACKISAR